MSTWFMHGPTGIDVMPNMIMIGYLVSRNRDQIASGYHTRCKAVSQLMMSVVYKTKDTSKKAILM